MKTEATLEFPWPCDRRDAHAPHEDLNAAEMTVAAIRAAMARPADEPACPGVEAHPSTMAGGSWTSW